MSTPLRAVTPRARPLASRAAFGFGTGIALGAGLGALAWLADQLPLPWGALIPANAIGVWLGLGFLLGASARTVQTGALRGLIGLLSAVAAYYARVRGVPTENVLALSIPQGETLSREDWQAKVRPAIRQWLSVGDRRVKIRCFVTVWDVPLKIGPATADL